ncbi:ABC transporter permease [Nonomuraea sp. LPB2021202275-12-8]|uniref:ABC transporter permease n=1 Tax=Nonomuraea sp. LPB2021202275-12-8 TaxID=3120159 RepID=UPI00300CF9F3
MLKLAMRSFAHHRATAIATGLVALVGMSLVTGMMSLLGTGLADSTAAADRAFLVPFPLIMGGWTVAIVLFAMVSTISVALGGRIEEMADIRLIGATPHQVQWMLGMETAALTAVAAPPGLAGGYLVGWLVTRSIQSAGLTDPASGFAPGVLLPVLGVLIVLAASVIAAWLGSRALARRSPVADAAPPPRRRTGRRPGSRRRITAAIMICAGLAHRPRCSHWTPQTSSPRR